MYHNVGSSVIVRFMTEKRLTLAYLLVHTGCFPLQIVCKGIFTKCWIHETKYVGHSLSKLLLDHYTQVSYVSQILILIQWYRPHSVGRGGNVLTLFVYRVDSYERVPNRISPFHQNYRGHQRNPVPDHTEGNLDRAHPSVLRSPNSGAPYSLSQADCTQGPILGQPNCIMRNLQLGNTYAVVGTPIADTQEDCIVSSFVPNSCPYYLKMVLQQTFWSP